MKLIHKIAHWLGWNKGNPESHWEGKKLIMCFRCSCGRLEDCFDATNLTKI